MKRVAVCALLVSLVALTGCPPKDKQPPAGASAPPDSMYAPTDSSSRGTGTGMMTDANTVPTYEPLPAAAPQPMSNTTTSTPPPKTTTSAAPRSHSRDETLRAGKSGRSGKTYVVKKGDTLSEISQKVYGTSTRWREIWNANKTRVKDPKKLQVGQTLIIP